VSSVREVLFGLLFCVGLFYFLVFCDSIVFCDYLLLSQTFPCLFDLCVLPLSLVFLFIWFNNPTVLIEPGLGHILLITTSYFIPDFCAFERSFVCFLTCLSFCFLSCACNRDKLDYQQMKHRFSLLIQTTRRSPTAYTQLFLEVHLNSLAQV
jgi:hypothetical protein